MNGSGTIWGWRTPGIYTQLLTRKRQSLRGCSGLATSATPFPERSRGRFWAQLENPMMGRYKGAKPLSEKLLPTLRLMCSSKQTSSCQRNCRPSFFCSWTLDIKASLGQGSPRIGAQRPLGKQNWSTVWVIQLPSAARGRRSLLPMLLAGLMGGGPADGVMKIPSWQMTRDLSLYLLWGAPNEGVYSRFTHSSLLVP